MTDPARVGALRQRNLSAVLTLVHRTGGMTRAELTATTGLNRSTIADVVGDLEAAGWVKQRDDSRREGVGRPSLRVVPGEDLLVAAINPELDALDIALVALAGRVISRRRIPLDRIPTVDDVVRLAAPVVRELEAELTHGTVIAAGVAVPGLVRESDGVVRFAPHLQWSDQPIATPLAAALSLPVIVANDAHLGALAEHVFGAGAGCANILYLNGGPSGIGGGLIVDGRPLSGAGGYAGEAGHIAAVTDGATCRCGARGCLETEVSRGRFVQLLKLAAPADDELEAAIVASRDPAVRREVERQWQLLAVAARGLVNLLNPERVILGGHLAALFMAIGTDRRRDLLAESLTINAHDAEVVAAGLGSSRLLIGAAEAAFAAGMADPAGYRKRPPSR